MSSTWISSDPFNIELIHLWIYCIELVSLIMDLTRSRNPFHSAPVTKLRNSAAVDVVLFAVAWTKPTDHTWTQQLRINGTSNQMTGKVCTITNN